MSAITIEQFNAHDVLNGRVFISGTEAKEYAYNMQWQLADDGLSATDKLVWPDKTIELVLLPGWCFWRLINGGE